MVRILERPESTSDKFARAFANVGQAIPGAIESYEKPIRERQAKTSKNLANLSKYVSGELKARGRKSLSEDPRYLENLLPEIEELVSQGYEPHEAFKKIYQDFEKDKPGNKYAEEPSLSQSLFQSLGGVAGSQLGGIGSLKNPIPQQMGSVAEDPLVNMLKKHPGRSAGLAALGTVAPFEEIIRSGPSQAAKDVAAKLGLTYPEYNEHPDLLSAKARRKLLEGVGEREAKAAPQLEFLGSLLPVERIAKLLGLGKAKAISPSEILLPEKAEQKLLGHAARRAEDVAPAAERSLAGRVAKQELTPTEMRVARTKPEQRIFPRTQNVKIREEQLKLHPKYVEEIEADAAKRAEQAASREPKTVKGRESRQIRQHEAEKAYPAVKEGYYKASSRVRALEDEYAAIPKAQRAQLDPLLEMAKQDLKEAEFSFKQATENLKGISYRASVPEMKEAAHKKLTAIQDTIQSGEEYKLAKMDYSPDLIKEAKRISKGKPIPYTPKDDFYNQVHQIYANEYRDRLGKVTKELEKLKEQEGLANFYKKSQLAKERDILKKMIESADAEMTIHKHKFGLRQISERKKAQERLSAFKKVQEQPKVKKAAEQKMWRERIRELKSPEGRAKIAEEVVEDAAKQNPKLAEPIRKEKSAFQEALGTMEKEAEHVAREIKTPPPPPKQSTQKAKSIISRFHDIMDGILKKVPIIGRTAEGRDVLVGVLTALWDEARRDTDLPVSGSTAAAALLGRKGGAQLRSASNAVAKWLIRQWKVNQAKNLYLKHDDEQLRKYSPSIRKDARERAFGN